MSTRVQRFCDGANCGKELREGYAVSVVHLSPVSSTTESPEFLHLAAFLPNTMHLDLCAECYVKLDIKARYKRFFD
jgi:hypothetical protein